MDKTTGIIIIEAFEGVNDRLSDIVNDCFNQKDWATAYKDIISFHNDISNSLFPISHGVFDELNDLYVELEWQLEEDISVGKSYFLDQVLTVSPVLSAMIVYHYISLGCENVSYIDTRDMLLSDNSYGDGIIDEPASRKNIERYNSTFRDANIVILPADIASSSENYGVCLRPGLLDEFLIQ